jgi:hypothetical protein
MGQHVYVVREATVTNPYQWSLIGVASTWENAKRIADSERGPIVWENDDAFGLEFGNSVEGHYAYRIDMCTVSVKSDAFFSVGR